MTSPATFEALQTPTLELNPEPATDFLEMGLVEAEQPKPEGFLARARNIGHNVLSSVSETFSNVADRFSTRVALGGLTMTAALAPGIAEANIVVGKGIGPVRIGQTKGQVRHELGRPAKIFDASNNPIDAKSHDSDFLYLFKGESLSDYLSGTSGLAYNIQFNPAGKVSSIDTQVKSQKINGVGVGSTYPATKRALPSFKCTTSRLPAKYGGGLAAQCVNKAKQPNGNVVITDFNFGDPAANHNRVFDVSVTDPSIDRSLPQVH